MSYAGKKTQAICGGMKKRALNDQQAAECAALRALFEKRQVEMREKGQKLSQYMVADRMGITQGAVNQMLRGINPINLQNAVAWSDILACSIEDFSPRLAAEAARVAKSTSDRVTEPEIAYSFERTGFAKSEKRDTDHAYKMPKMTAIQIKSFDQILDGGHGSDLFMVIGDQPDTAFAFELESDHMEGAPVFIQRGAMLIVNPEITAQDHDVILANIDGPVVGILSAIGGRLLAVPSRDKLPAISIERHQILGVVTGWYCSSPRRQR